MKKQLAFVLSLVTNFILSIFSYFYLCISITGTVKWSGYEIQEPEKGAYVFIGVTMLVVYILAGITIQYVLYKLSKQSKKRYAIFMSMIYIAGLITGYFLSLRL